jgi:hypothetical protein
MNNDHVQQTPLTDRSIGISAPAQRALTAAGYIYLEELTSVRVSELQPLHGMGPKALQQLRQALAARGLSFAEE